ncbi:MAG: hypothetical protein ACI8QC_002092 [Planctomycetota bacterium]|jgi:hypothetical protein
MSAKKNPSKGQGPNESAESQPEEHHFLEDEFHVPTGTSRKTFLLTLALTIFLLVIFTVGGLFQSVLSGGGGVDEVYLSWTDPETGVQHDVLGADFMQSKRSLDRLWRAGVYAPLNRNLGRKAKITEEDVVLQTVLDGIAVREGVDVSLDEFTSNLRNNGWTSDLLRQEADRNRMNNRDFEAELRAGMRPGKLRFLLLNAASMVADPEQVVSDWQEQNPQYTFEYVTLAAADMEAAAVAATPDDEALEAWYGELPAWDQQKYFSDEKVLATVAYLPLDGQFDATKLFEKYPLPEDWVAEDQARSYYNRYASTRFKNPEAEKDEEATDEEATDDGATDEEATDDGATEEEATDDGATEEEATDEQVPEVPEVPVPLYLEFEAVAERAAEEARLNEAMTAFLTDIRGRHAEDGVEADLASEAVALGLSLWHGDDALPKTDFETVESWGGPQIATHLGFGIADSYLARVVAEQEALIVAFVREKTPREAKPFAEVRDEIATRWSDDHAIDLAVETLEALRDSFGERPVEESDEGEEGEENEEADDQLALDEPEADWAPVTDSEAFRAAVAKLSGELTLESALEVTTRGPLGRREFPDDDAINATPADRYIVSQQVLFDLEAGQVSAAGKDGTGTIAVLVRLVEEAAPDAGSIKAAELLSARSRLVNESFRNFEAEVLNPSSDWFKERYKIDLRSWREAEENGEEEGETETETSGM